MFFPHVRSWRPGVLYPCGPSLFALASSHALGAGWGQRPPPQTWDSKALTSLLLSQMPLCGS